MDDRPIVRCILRHGADVLSVRRPDSDRWDVVSASVDPETSPTAVAHDAVAALGFPDATEIVRSADPIVVDADGTARFCVYPFLFDCEPTVRNAAGDDAVWIQPPELLDRDTVTGLWETYLAVAPTVRTVREDTTHGSAYVSIRALEVLRDRAAVAARDDDDYDAVVTVARDLRDARPSMGVVANRINRVLATADRTAAAVATHASEACDRAVAADTEAAERVADLLGERVLTLSRSGTVRDAIRIAGPERVYVAEARPAREGIALAEALTEDTAVTLCVDAAVAHVVTTEAVDTVLVGADTVTGDAVVNKVGTHLAALTADRCPDVSCYAVCARDKIVAGSSTDIDLEAGSAAAVYDGDEPIDVVNPTFEATPTALFSAIVTDDGVLTGQDVERIADDHAALAEWDR